MWQDFNVIATIAEYKNDKTQSIDRLVQITQITLIYLSKWILGISVICEFCV